MNYSDFLNNDSSAFQKRFISLLNDSNSQKYYSDLIGTSPQNLNNWLKGKSTPDMNGLICISNTFGVSVDWLIGLSDIRSSNPTIKEICSYIGLNEYTIQSLHIANEAKARYLSAFNELCRSGEMWTICSLIVNTSEEIRNDVERAEFLTNNINRCKLELAIHQKEKDADYKKIADDISCMSAELEELNKKISFQKWDINTRIQDIISPLILSLAKNGDYNDYEDYEIDENIFRYEKIKDIISEIDQEIFKANDNNLKKMLEQIKHFRTYELNKLAGFIRIHRPEYFGE